jgi:hypothetical protein
MSVLMEKRETMLEGLGREEEEVGLGLAERRSAKKGSSDRGCALGPDGTSGGRQLVHEPLLSARADWRLRTHLPAVLFFLRSFTLNGSTGHHNKAVTTVLTVPIPIQYYLRKDSGVCHHVSDGSLGMNHILIIISRHLSA